MATDTSTSAEQRFVDRIKALRKERGWTQAQLAERMARAGVEYASQSTVSRLEQGGRPIRLIEAQALAIIFQLTIWELTSDEPRVQVLSIMEHNLRAFTRARMDYRKARSELVTMLPTIDQTLSELDRLFPGGEDGLAPDAAERVRNFRSSLERQRELAQSDLRVGNNPFWQGEDVEHQAKA